MSTDVQRGGDSSLTSVPSGLDDSMDGYGTPRPRTVPGGVPNDSDGSGVQSRPHLTVKINTTTSSISRTQAALRQAAARELGLPLRRSGSIQERLTRPPIFRMCCPTTALRMTQAPPTLRPHHTTTTPSTHHRSGRTSTTTTGAHSRLNPHRLAKHCTFTHLSSGQRHRDSWPRPARAAPAQAGLRLVAL